jgi:L-aminopeptidase/D-esterase-like protein
MEHQAQITAIDGLRIGHWSDPVRRTGCTVLLCPAGAVAGVDVRGGAPGTRETALLQPGRLVDRVHAIVLTGGSAFGLAAADGVMRWLAERGFGFDAGVARVPIVPTAVLFDLAVGDPAAYPDAAAGYAACESAGTDVAVGAVGAGSGALVGKVLGTANASPGGIGSATRQLPDGSLIGALVAVNAFGHVVDPATNTILAGARGPAGALVDTVDVLLNGAPAAAAPTNTTIGVIVTDAPLDGAACTRIAATAHTGMARAIRPVHTLFDGDTLFVLSLPRSDAPPANPMLLGVAAAEVVTAAILNAVRPQTLR